jgi:hypothetical protein
MGIAKPFIFSATTVTGSSNMINLNNVNSIDKSNVEINALEQNATPKFLIIFSMNGHNQNLQQLKLTYATEDARDEDYEAIQEYVGVDLGDLPGGGVPA